MKTQLIKAAEQAREHAYIPYSTFPVGAALLTESGKIFSGCNIENASFGLTCCAERVAIFKAVSEGETDFKALAVIGDTEEAISPCGACRQVMAEFFTEDVRIFLANMKGNVSSTSIAALLPYSFRL